MYVLKLVIGSIPWTASGLSVKGRCGERMMTVLELTVRESKGLNQQVPISTLSSDVADEIPVFCDKLIPTGTGLPLRANVATNNHFQFRIPRIKGDVKIQGKVWKLRVKSTRSLVLYLWKWKMFFLLFALNGNIISTSLTFMFYLWYIICITWKSQDILLCFCTWFKNSIILNSWSHLRYIGNKKTNFISRK